MMTLNLQFFGGRGSSGGNNPKGSVEKENKTYHVDHTDSAGGEFIDSGTINGKKIGSRVSLEYGGETRTGKIVGAHKYPNGRVDFTVEMDKSKFSKATTKTVGESRLNEKSSNRTATEKSIQNFRETDQKLKFTTSDGQKDTITRTGNRVISNSDRKNIPKNRLPKGAESGFTENALIKGTNRVGKTYMVQTQYVFYPRQGATSRMESKTLSIKEVKNTESTKKKKK